MFGNQCWMIGIRFVFIGVLTMFGLSAHAAQPMNNEELAQISGAMSLMLWTAPSIAHQPLLNWTQEEGSMHERLSALGQPQPMQTDTDAVGETVVMTLDNILNWYVMPFASWSVGTMLARNSIGGIWLTGQLDQLGILDLPAAWLPPPTPERLP